MSTRISLSHRSLIATLSLSAGLLALPAQAQTTEDTYRADIAACEHMPDGSKQACRRDAGAAQQTRRQQPAGAHESGLQNNRHARCLNLPADHQQDCLMNMEQGANTTVRGSVEGGGILRETTVTVPATTR